MKYSLVLLLVVGLSGCANLVTEDAGVVGTWECAGSNELPPKVAADFEVIEDESLLTEALGNPEMGKLCQGQVYVAKAETTVNIYRAWNSTNPNSQFGSWWAFYKPSGSVAEYRSDYEICYQWSALDKLVSCTLKPGTKVVVGTGQSAKCSEYLTYPVSDKNRFLL